MIRTTLTHAAHTLSVARSTRRRRGVTLVEMMVATAMCILGMWMLTWMFQQATASFSLANQQATLTGTERLVTTIMTRDIDQDRFPEDESFPNRGRRLRDLGTQRPQRGGYFLAHSKSAQAGNTNANVLEGPTPSFTDLYGYGSSRSTNHFVAFTTILQDTPGNRYFAEVSVMPDPPATVPVPRNTAGVAAEISYYLVRNGQTPNGVPLYDLMRVQRIVAQNQYDARDYLRDIVIPGYRAQPGYPAGDNVHEVMACMPGNPPQMLALRDLGGANGPFWTNTPRLWPFPAPVVPPVPAGPPTAARSLSSRRFGEDRLMTNVLSMEIKFTTDRPQFYNFGLVSAGNPDAWPRASATTPPSPNMWPRPLLYDNTNPEHPAGYQGNSDYPFDNLPFDGRFDTSDVDGSRANQPPNVQPGTLAGAPTRSNRPLVITGVQIRIRAFMGGTTRQTTLTLAL